MVNRRLFSAVPSYSRSFPDTKPKGLSPSVLKQRAFACHPMCEPRHLEPHMFYRKKHLEILLKTPFKDGKRVLFWRSDCCLGFRLTTLALRGPCTACCLGRTCRWPTKEACGRRTACLEGECSKEAPICLYLTSFFVHMCADGKPPPPETLTATCGWTCFTRCWTFQTPARCRACGASAAGWTRFCRRTMATNYPRLRAGWWCCCWRTARRCGDNGYASLWKKGCCLSSVCTRLSAHSLTHRTVNASREEWSISARTNA